MKGVGSMGGMVPEDVYELAWVSDPRLSPDGRTVAFVVNGVDREANDYDSAVWTVPADGSAPPRRVTFGPSKDLLPRWSPDGTRLAFVSKRGPNDEDAAQLFVLPVTGGGEAVRLTEGPEDVSEVEWAPDGTRLAFVTRVRGPEYGEPDDRARAPRRFTRLQYKLDSVGWTGDRPRHVFVVDADGSNPPVQLTTGEAEDHHPSWSPDGSRLAFVSARHQDWDTDTLSDLYVVSAAGGEPEILTATDGSSDAPSWSPDGTRIAHRVVPGRFDDPRHPQIAVLDLATRARTVLTSDLDRSCGPYPEIREPLWDGDDLLFAVEDQGNTHLYRAAADGSSKPNVEIDGEQALTGYDAVGGRVVHTASTPTAPAELFAGNDRLTAVTDAFVGGREIVEPERFTAVSADGTEVEAWMVRPAGYEEGRRYPCLLNIHGGPFTQYANRFFDEFQVYAGAGYAVVYANPRGSSGYSEAWGRAIRGPVDGGRGWGGVDYEDLMGVMDEAVKRFDFVDPDRLGVMGGSYGGFMTSWIVGHTDRFAAAISERAVNSLVSMWGSSDFGWDFKGYFGSFLWEDVESYVRMSPLTYAKDITTPVLILHSESDLRCPIEQGEQLFVTLRLLKRDVEMVRFPEESHELTRSGHPAHRVHRFHIILDWLRDRLSE